MYNVISMTADNKVGSLSLLSYRYKDIPGSQYRELKIVYGEDEHECIVFHDSELPRSSTYEIRGDGIWADANCEVDKEHWSFSLESFALRVPVDEYLSYRESDDGLLIGDRIPFGYELDATTNDGEEWVLSGEIFVEKNEIDVAKLPIKFSLK